MTAQPRQRERLNGHGFASSSETDVWFEVSKANHDRLLEVWDRPDQYASVRFSGRVANDVQADLDLPVKLGSELQLHVPNTDAPPQVEAAMASELSELLSRTWAKAAFEEYAFARGFL